MKSREIRQQFISFFQDKQHHFVRSSSVVPVDDPTLLFTNAGMNQFKPIFLGQEQPAKKRAVNSQKCIRVSGKHNDLEEVGVDDYHHTFFEMLGNWSFGDYYKKEAIAWAWELLTEVWKLDKSRLWVTIFQDDDEAGKIWKENTDIEPSRVLKFGHKDNFWEMGETGPCGPCSEIHYYSGNDPENQIPEGVNRDDDYREIWNLVFIQYNRGENGQLEDLPAKHVDTGAGFERIVAVMNGTDSNYETDLFVPIIDKICRITGKSLEFENGIPHRVIADHIRMLSFSIADGAMPGSDGRGYVLRRVLRRAARFGRTLEMQEPFLYKLVAVLTEIMGDAFPELAERQNHIVKVIRAEETSFGETLDRGIEIFEKITGKLNPGSMISGDDAFRLYDTYGFPLDLTELMAREKELQVDAEGFNLCMQDQKERARKAGKFQMDGPGADWTVILDQAETEFLGYRSEYDTRSLTAKITKYRNSDSFLELVLDKTPFYGEKGGQIGDTGVIKVFAPDGEISLAVADTQWILDDLVHCCEIDESVWKQLKEGQLLRNEIQVIMDGSRRRQIRANHTATHLMHKALKTVLGDHVHQAGSLVSDQRLRFDLTHYQQVSSAEIREIESIVNSEILTNTPVETEVLSYDEAREKGAVALFGEKYGDAVRVVDVPGFSMELCGGTHVSATGEIGAFKIISESALSAGIRRIEAVTGQAVLTYLNSLEEIVRDCRDVLKCKTDEVPIRIQNLMNEKKELEKALRQFRVLTQKDAVKELVQKAPEHSGVRLVVSEIQDTGDLKELGDAFRSEFGSRGAALIGTIQNEKPMVVCAVTDDLTGSIQAGKIVKSVGQKMGGGGGGRPHLATAGGKHCDALSGALEFGKELMIAAVSD